MSVLTVVHLKKLQEICAYYQDLRDLAWICNQNGTLITWRSVACLSTLEVVKATLIVLTLKKIVVVPVPRLSCKMTFASNLKKRVLVETIWKGITSIQRMEPANSFTMEAAKGTKTILKAFRLAKAGVLSTFPFPSKKTLNLNFASLLWMKAQNWLLQKIFSKDGITTVLMELVKTLNSKEKKETEIAF